MFWSTTLPAVTGTDTLGLHLRNLREQQQDGGQQPKPAVPSAATFRYTPSLQRRTANLAQFVAKSRQNDPKGADDLARVFASTDVIEAMRAPLAEAGLRIDDVADAYAVYWINAWQASRGVDDDVSRRMATAVRNQVAGVMASTGALRGASDAAKQEMAESLLIQAALIGEAMKQSQGNPALSRQLAAAVSQGARGMNLDLASMTLTEDGFVRAD
ncbi:hypothetical protein KXR53_02295 [Inquilinus limosus]|uniref:DUF6683 family protein n=1 Tax=Inquilinus limosus TaxID=171674 RepID=UPI003F146FF3